MKTFVDLFPISTDRKDVRAGILMLPDDFDTNPAKCPLIVFVHGSGEYGSRGSLANIDALYKNGSPLTQARAGLLNSITCPVTAKAVRPVIFALQGLPAWCCQANEMVAGIKMLQQGYSFKNADGTTTVIDVSKIDFTGIIVTGLSAGGEVTFEMMGGPDTAMFAAGIPLSCAPAPNDTIITWPNLAGRLWALHGDADNTGITNNGNSVKAINQVNGAMNGRGFFSTWAATHCCWDVVYNPSYRKVLPVTANGVAVTKAISLYEFGVMCRNTTVKFTASGTDAGISGTNPTVMSAKAVAKATYNKDKSFTLDGTGTTGDVGSFRWDFTPPVGVATPWWADGRPDGGSPISIKMLQNIQPGTWILKLSVQDKLNALTQDIVTVQVNADGSSSIVSGGTATPPVNTPPVTTDPVKPKVLQSFFVDTSTGNMVLTLKYTDGTTEIKPS